MSMYIPKPFEQTDSNEMIRFMKQHPFAVCASTCQRDRISASHLPFVIDDSGGELTLISHMARANPLVQSLQEEREFLVIFSGPHAYISPTLYDSPINVPTWNYIAVHAYGRGEVIREAEHVKKTLVQMITQFEPSYMEQWSDLPPDYVERMSKGIVAFKVRVTRLMGQWKLSQNKSETEQLRIQSRLLQEQNPLADWMTK
ncbi:MAG: FMN-binding negative transcriptional regulator [Thermoactinomyces sp.]